jgi:hypothetical protein
VFGGGRKCTEIKINRKFNAFTDFESLELEVLMFYFVIEYVLVYRNGRYFRSNIIGAIEDICYSFMSSIVNIVYINEEVA